MFRAAEMKVMKITNMLARLTAREAVSKSNNLRPEASQQMAFPDNCE
jgi:hypothetical protein